jgi:flagellar hook assembly protein FlgD
VATLVDGGWSAGWHSVPWTGRDERGARVPAGVYMARLEALGQVRTRRIVLIR